MSMLLKSLAAMMSFIPSPFTSPMAELTGLERTGNTSGIAKVLLPWLSSMLMELLLEMEARLSDRTFHRR